MIRNLLFLFGLSFFLGACSPGFEPAEDRSKPLDLQGDSQDAGGDLAGLFDRQEKTPAEPESPDSDTIRATEPGTEPTTPAFIGDGPPPEQVGEEPLLGPAPIDMQQEEARVAAEPAPAERSPAPSGERTPEEPSLPPVQEPEEPSLQGTAGSENQEEEEPAAELADLESLEEDSSEAAPVGSLEANLEEDAPDFTEPPRQSRFTPHAERLLEIVQERVRFPFEFSDSHERFWQRYDHFLSGLPQEERGPQEREFFRIPRCSGTAENPARSRWPHWSDHPLGARPLYSLYVEDVGPVNVANPLSVLDLMDTFQQYGEAFPYPFYDVIDEFPLETPADPILAHTVNNHSQLAHLSVATSKEIFEHSISHAFQMSVDAQASLALSERCLLSTGGASCPEFQDSFNMHYKAHRLQRLALALALAEEGRRCSSEWTDVDLNRALETNRRSCFFQANLSHSPEVWELRTYYNPLKNLVRRSSDIDHWAAPVPLADFEVEDLQQVLKDLLGSLAPEQRESGYLQLKDLAVNVYRNTTLLFPALRFVSSSQLTAMALQEGLSKVSAETNKISSGGRIHYEQFKNLRLFPLAMMARMESRAPTEVCDIAEEAITLWSTQLTLPGQLAVDQSFYLLPLEIHGFIPPEMLSYNVFEGQAWEYFGQILYDFAESRAWAFSIASNAEDLRVTSPEIAQVAEEVLKLQGLKPEPQGPRWETFSAVELLKALLQVR